MKTAERLVKHFGGDEKPSIARRRAAKALKMNPETLRLWLRDGIPLERALYVEEKTGGRITADEILQEARQSA